MSDFITRLSSAKETAHSGPIGKRRSSFVLYNILVRCYGLAFECLLNEANRKTLEALVRNQPSEGRGRWTLQNSDVFLLVCRYVFPRNGTGRGELSNASRYASAMREAAKQNMSQERFSTVLCEDGGIQKLFLARPLKTTEIKTKTLHLDRSIVIHKNLVFTLTLRRLPDNNYEVIAQKDAAP